MGMVHACQKYGTCPSDKVKELALQMKYKDAEKFAKTKEKGLPEKVAEGVTMEYKTFKEWVAELDEAKKEKCCPECKCVDCKCPKDKKCGKCGKMMCGC
jgi:hypothetical protein